MKAFILTATLLTLLLTYTDKYSYASNVAQSLCEYVAADDKKRMRSFLKTNRLKIRSVFTGIECNGKNLLAFAAENGSIKTGSLMISKLPKSVVTENLATLESGPKALLDAAIKRTGG